MSTSWVWFEMPGCPGAMSGVEFVEVDGGWVCTDCGQFSATLELGRAAMIARHHAHCPRLPYLLGHRARVQHEGKPPWMK